MATKFQIIIAGTSFTVPADWNSSNNVIHCIGAGSNGGAGSGSGSGTIGVGGAGGSYAHKANVALTAGATANCQIGVVGGTVTVPGGTAHTWASSNTTVRGAGASGQAAGSVANSVGDTGAVFAGGSGAASGSGGGGGAAGPSGAGATATGTSGGTGNNGTVAAAASGAFWTDNSGGANNGLSAGAGGGGNAATAKGVGGAAGHYGAGGGAGKGSGNAGGAGQAGLIVLEWTPVPPAITGTESAALASFTAAGTISLGTIPWTPANLGSARGWYKADELSGADLSDVGTFPDASGTSNTATTAGNSPQLRTAALNGLSVLQFTQANSDTLALPTGAVASFTQGALFFVAKPSAESGVVNGPPLGGTGTNGAADHYPYADGNVYYGFLSSSRPNCGDPGTIAAWHIGGFQSANGDYRASFNGTDYFTTVSNTVAPATSPPAMGVGAGIYFDGQIAEILLCNSALTTDERQQVEGYLAWKWGLVANLPAAHPYKTAAPTYTPPSPISATASVTPANFTAVAGTKVRAKGSAALVLASFSGTSAARLRIKAAAAITPNAFASAAAVKALIDGLGSGSLNAFSAASAAKVKTKAAAAPTIASFGASSTATARVKAAAAATPDPFVSAASARALVHGTGAGLLNAFGSAASARVRINAAASAAPDAFTVISTAAVQSSAVIAQAAIALSPFVGIATARARVAAMAAAEVAVFSSAAAAKVRLLATAATEPDSFESFGRISASAVEASGSFELAEFSSAASLAVLIRGQAAVPLGEFALSAALVGPAYRVPMSRTTFAGNRPPATLTSARADSLTVTQGMRETHSQAQRVTYADREGVNG